MKSLLEKSTGGVALGRCSLRLVWWIAMCQCLAGCHDGIELPSASRLLEFEAAGPSGPAVDMERLVKAKIPMGPYHVNFGDVLQLVLPPTLYPDVAPGPTGRGLTHICRVDDAGLVTLPDGRLIPVGGHALTEIEAAIVKTYYPDLVKKRPAVYASVHEYSIQRVRILGAVARPGVYSLRPDQMSLVALLMEAGGVVETGAAAIRIISPRASTAKVAGHHALSGRGSVGTKRSVRAGLANLSPEIGLSFEPEGPLRTTGWLVVDAAHETVTRQWLDIANRPQRQAVLDKSARTCSQLPVGVADAKLSRLAGLLDSLEADGLVHLAAYAPEGDWRVAGGHRFALGLQKVAVDQAGMGAEVPVDVYATKEGGPAGDEPTDNSETALVLPVRGLNIPFADVPLHEGDSVVVERFEPQYVTVLGLVGSPGNYPYPPEAQYNLAETVAFAGGLDMIAKPRYVSMYRLRADGTVASATFELVDPDNQEELTSSLATRVKPGDIVSVESTPRTRTNVFFDRYFRFSTGMYLSPPEEIWDSVGLVDSP